MTLERGILVAFWLICFAIGMFLVPRNRLKEGCILFLSAQVITWPVGLLLVELGLITHPVREFPIATRANFTLNYLLYPMVSMAVLLYYPTFAPKWKRAVYQVVTVGGLSGLMQLVDAYTDLIHHVKFNWLLSFLIMLFALNATRTYTAWYFGGLKRNGGGDRA
ncbi:CBO0543 family protein [Paenibacillus sp. YN15]|uniref:CBO0543 family protein n=1 Tax=Paenibacillus sp. YN15 TaxID=1742774 RepID=UPI000DCAF040|nr:CBO0543 family protein [Paenibacillus sp. YN15]RAU91987.1 hypothetical protein DQG13_28250 [Paenibacillus sp. YN15]